MTSIADTIAANARLTLAFAEAIAKDIPADRFGRFSTSASGEPVNSNHPAFVYGHLCLYPGRCAEMLGAADSELKASDAYEALFAPNVECRDDTDGSIYPSKDELVSKFMQGQASAIELILNASDAKLLEDTPVERYRERFPYVGSVVAFLTSGHAMMHLGQVSAWRRFEGLGSAM